MSSIQFANRLRGYTAPSIWAVISALALETKSANLGQGFPDYQIPAFFENELKKSISANHQYARSFGHLPLIRTLTNFYQPYIKQPLNQDKIVVVNGGVQGLFDVFLGLLNEGDEVILFDPSYDCYRPQIQMSGGKAISVPLIPPKPRTKQNLLHQGFSTTDKDEWQINWDLLEKSINSKTKMILVNSPHNPTGKIFSQAELQKISDIIKKNERIIVVEDAVYEHLSFLHKPFDIPRVINIPELQKRTVVVCSAGKLFSATGLRIGWVIGAEELIVGVRSVHQFNAFTINGSYQVAVANSLEETIKNNYFEESRQEMIKKKNFLLKGLAESKLDIDLYLPNGGYFAIANIERENVDKKYLEDGKQFRDFAYTIQTLKEKNVATIPVSPFYGTEEAKSNQNYLRFAYCKGYETMEQAFKNYKSK